MNNLFQKVASMEAAKPSHYSFSPSHDGRPRAIMVKGPQRHELAKGLRARFGDAIMVLDAVSMETQQIDHASGAGVPIVGIYRAPVKGLNNSDSGSVLMEEIKRLGLDAQDGADSRLTDAIVLHEDTGDDTEEGTGQPTPDHHSGYHGTPEALTPVYASIESFLEDFAKTAVFEVRTESNESFFEDEARALARVSTSSLEDAEGATMVTTVRGLTIQPCSHGHGDPDSECPLCEMMADANDEALAPVMTEEGKIIDTPASRIKVMPNKRPALAHPDEAGQMGYKEHSDGEQTIIIDADMVIEDD